MIYYYDYVYWSYYMQQPVWHAATHRAGGLLVYQLLYIGSKAIIGDDRQSKQAKSRMKQQKHPPGRP